MGLGQSSPSKCDEGLVRVDGTCITMETMKTKFNLTDELECSDGTYEVNGECITMENVYETFGVVDKITADQLADEKAETSRLGGLLKIEEKETERLGGLLETEEKETERLGNLLTAEQQKSSKLTEDLGEAKEHYKLTSNSRLCGYLHKRKQCNVDPNQCVIMLLENKHLALGAEFEHNRRASSKDKCNTACLENDTCLGANWDGEACYIVKKWGVGIHKEEQDSTVMFKSCGSATTSQIHADIMGECPSIEDTAKHQLYVSENRHRFPEKTDKEILANHLLSSVLPEQKQIPINGVVYHDFWRLPDNFGMWTTRMKVGTCADGSNAVEINSTVHSTVSEDVMKKNMLTTIKLDTSAEEGKQYSIKDSMNTLPQGSFIKMISPTEGHLVKSNGDMMFLTKPLDKGSRITLTYPKQLYSCDGQENIECERPIVGGACGGIPTPEDCKKTCDVWTRCQGFYHNGEQCLFYDDSCHEVDQCDKEHYIFGDSATRLSGVTKEEGKYTLGFPLSKETSEGDCQNKCQAQEECKQNDVKCRSLFVPTALEDEKERATVTSRERNSPAEIQITTNTRTRKRLNQVTRKPYRVHLDPGGSLQSVRSGQYDTMRKKICAQRM